MNAEQMVPLSSSIKLLRIIGSPLTTTEASVDNNEPLELHDYAIKNKIPLLYLDSLRQQGKLNELKTKYEEEYTRYSTFLNGLAKVSKVLNTAEIDYAVFKTIKPFSTVQGDVDIIILGDDDMYKKAVEALLKASYIPQLSELVDVKTLTSEEEYNRAVELLIKPTYGKKQRISPGGGDLIDPAYNLDIDLQKEVATSHVIYIDKNNFRGDITETVLLKEAKIKVPTPELDMALVIAHSLVEQMYLLGEFYTLLYRLSKMDEEKINNFIDILKVNKLIMAARTFVTITSALCKEAYGEVPEKIERLLNELGYEESEARRLITNGFKVPHRYGWLTLSKVFLEKMNEKRFRRSVAVQMVKMLDPRLMRLVISSIIEMRQREFYLKEVE
jgi:hypothetical protein